LKERTRNRFDALSGAEEEHAEIRVNPKKHKKVPENRDQ